MAFYLPSINLCIILYLFLFISLCSSAPSSPLLWFRFLDYDLLFYFSQLFRFIQRFSFLLPRRVSFPYLDFDHLLDWVSLLSISMLTSLHSFSLFNFEHVLILPLWRNEFVFFFFLDCWSFCTMHSTFSKGFYYWCCFVGLQKG